MRIPSMLRLTTIILASAAAVAPLATLAAQDAQDADVKAIQSVQLTVPLLNRLAQVQDNMYAAVKAHPELSKKYAEQQEDPGDNVKSIDDMAKKLDLVPEMKAAVIKAGFTPRSYMIATMATFQAAMASAVLDMPGVDKSQIPPNARANAAFLKTHAAEFQKLQRRGQEIEKLTRPRSSDDASGDAAPDSTH
ncbi:MAG: hypothetical protein ACJ79K_10835 [Gemmatimonadaceae bacterium]